MNFRKIVVFLSFVFASVAVSAPFVNDTFTDTNGATVPPHVGETGATWTNLYGANSDVKIQSNRAWTNSSSAFLVASGTPPSADYDVYARVYVASVVGEQVICGRWRSDGGVGYGLDIQTTQVRLIKQSGFFGTITSIGSYSISWVAGQTYSLILRLNGNQLSVLIDGVEVIAPVTDTTYASADKVGFLASSLDSTTTGFQFDQFAAGPVGSFVVLSPGAVAITVTSDTAVSVSQTAAATGTATFTYQLQRAPDSSGSPGTFANVGSAQSGLALGVAPSAVADTGLTTGSIYWYRSVVTDLSPATTPGASKPVLVRLGRNYYISAAGNDSNNGTTTGTSWLTVSKVLSFGFVPGDTFNFNGGDTFTIADGIITSIAVPTKTTPITVRSYGTGRPIFSNGTSEGWIVKQSYVTLYNLAVDGAGFTLSGTAPNRTLTTTMTPKWGISFDFDDTDVYHEGIVVDNCLVTNCYNGIGMYSADTSITARLSGTRITRCIVHDCVQLGIALHGSNTAHYNRGVYVSDCQAYNIYGLTTRPMGFGAMGFGIYLQNCEQSLVQRCVAHHLGECMDPTTGAGVEAFMFVNCDSCVFLDCEGYLVYSTSGYDSNAFEFDLNVTNSGFDHCYGHDTAGASVGCYGSGTGNYVRYCTFVSTATRNAGILYDQTGNSTQWSNNSLYFHKTSTPAIAFSATNVQMINNVIWVENAATFGTISGGSSTWNGNTYALGSGSSFSLSLGGTTYTSLASMQAAGFEMLDGQPVGASGDPVWSSGGSATIQLPTNQVSNLSAYNLGVGSVARGSGVNPQRFGIDPERDWHANSGSYGADQTYNGWDAGAVRYGSTVPTSSSSPAFAY